MLKNYLKVAFRSLLRQKTYSIINIRASVSNVVILLSKDFTKLILIAFVLTVPVAWYVMATWLDEFVFRITLGIGVFLVTGGAALTTSWLTVSYQSIRAAIANPVKSLRNE